MGAIGRLLTVLGLIVILMIGATLARGPAGTMVAQWGDLHASTTMPVALGLLLAALVLAYYFGQLVFYLGGLPGIWRAGKGHKKRAAVLQEIAQGLAAERLGLRHAAHAQLNSMESEEPALQQVAAAARLLLGETDVPVGAAMAPIRKQGGGDYFRAAHRLNAAKAAAAVPEWTQVAALAGEGLSDAPDSPYLLALRLKALINLGDLPSAAALQERVAAYLTPTGQRELQALVAPGSKIMRTAEAPTLSATATVKWQSWLNNADEQFPEQLDGQKA